VCNYAMTQHGSYRNAATAALTTVTKKLKLKTKTHTILQNYKEHRTTNTNCNITRRALGGAHVPPTKLFPQLAVNKPF